MCGLSVRTIIVLPENDLGYLFLAVFQGEPVLQIRKVF